MSKTFKSAKSTLELTVVRTNEDLVRIITQLPDETGRAIDLAPSDAPALALAILEAAGADSDLTWSGAKDYGNADHLGWIAGHLGAYIKTQERVTAEAEEQAELEAEALDSLAQELVDVDMAGADEPIRAYDAAVWIRERANQYKEEA